MQTVWFEVFASSGDCLECSRLRLTLWHHRGRTSVSLQNGCSRIDLQRDRGAVAAVFAVWYESGLRGVHIQWTSRQMYAVCGGRGSWFDVLIGAVGLDSCLVDVKYSSWRVVS